MAVVCAGPKAILDVPATLEYLETRGVPVVAVGQAELPGFYARSAGIPAPDCVPDIAAAAGLVATHLGLGARWRRSSSACRCPRPRRCPTTWPATPSSRPIAEAAAAGIARPGADAVAARADRRADRAARRSAPTPR